MLDEKYLDKIRNTEFVTEMVGGVCMMNENLKDDVLKFVNSINFNSLYPTMMLQFHKEGIADCLTVKDMDTLEYYLVNKDSLRGTDEYISIRAEVNKMYSKYYMKDSLGSKMNKYLSMYYDEFIELNPFSWIYIDTDEIYYIGYDVKLPEGTKFPFSKGYYDYGIFTARKKFVLLSEDGFKTRGYHNKSERSVMDAEQTKSKLRSISRADKLNSLL